MYNARVRMHKMYYASVSCGGPIIISDSGVTLEISLIIKGTRIFCTCRSYRLEFSALHIPFAYVSDVDESSSISRWSLSFGTRGRDTCSGFVFAIPVATMTRHHCAGLGCALKMNKYVCAHECPAD